MAKVKICGLTDVNDALKACEFGADFLGFIFFKQSPRHIEPERARVIIKNLPGEISKVGLFFNQDTFFIYDVADKCHIEYLQLHGDESVEMCRILKQKYKIIKSFKVKNDRSIDDIDEYAECCDYYLFDTYIKDIPGGTGARFDWGILKTKNFKKPIFLAGGLTPENVTSAIKEVNPFAVDVASGVEREPGKKDYKLLREFIENAKKI